jgi:hypothetical protein
VSLTLALGGLVGGLAGLQLYQASRQLADRSLFYLGRSRAEERALSRAAGVDLARFAVLAQRVVWGVLQPDLIRVDVAAASQRLLAELPDFFGSHLVVAFAERAHGRPDAADQALGRARALLAARPGEDPFAYVMPTPAEWACEPPAPHLEEIVPDQIWRVSAYYTHGLCPFHEFAYATLIRRPSGQLILINPVDMPPELHARVAQLGPVSHLVIPLKFHNLFIAGAQRAFPAAQTIGVAGHRKNPPSAHLHLDAVLDDRAPLFPGELEQLQLGGHQFEETVFFHPATSTLILHDLLFGSQPGVPGYSFWWRLYCFVFGVHDGFAIPSYQPMLWTNVLALRQSVARMLAWRPERALVAHAPAAALATGAHQHLDRACAWITQLGPADYAVLVGAYFRQQPGFLRDLLRYLVRQGL